MSFLVSLEVIPFFGLGGPKSTNSAGVLTCITSAIYDAFPGTPKWWPGTMRPVTITGLSQGCRSTAEACRAHSGSLTISQPPTSTQVPGSPGGMLPSRKSPTDDSDR
jgi:hypothetical protein